MESPSIPTLVEELAVRSKNKADEKLTLNEIKNKKCLARYARFDRLKKECSDAGLPFVYFIAMTDGIPAMHCLVNDVYIRIYDKYTFHDGIEYSDAEYGDFVKRLAAWLVH